jgi:hypothetical protein
MTTGCGGRGLAATCGTGFGVALCARGAGADSFGGAGCSCGGCSGGVGLLAVSAGALDVGLFSEVVAGASFLLLHDPRSSVPDRRRANMRWFMGISVRRDYAARNPHYTVSCDSNL